MKIKKLLFTTFASLLSLSFATAQPNIQWQKCLGGSGDDEVFSIQQTVDGGYIVAGRTESNDGDVSGNHGGVDCWVVKLTSLGTMEWQKAIGGSGSDIGWDIQQTNEGGFIVAGSSDSNDGDVSGNHGSVDYWVVKLSSIGSIEWQKSFGGTSYDEARSIQQTNDGGFIVAGSTFSNDGDVSGNHGAYETPDFWVVKLSSLGTIEWQKSLGGSSYDFAFSIQQTNDGDYIVAGSSYSNDVDVLGNHGSWDCWVVKIINTGTIEWQKCLGGTGDDEAHSIQQTNDGGYIVAGSSASNDVDVLGNHGSWDCWVVKISNTGTIEWQKSLGGSSRDKAYCIQQTIDGGYIVAGYSNSNDGDVSGNESLQEDYWLVKLTSLGTIEWQKALGGTGDDEAASINQTFDGGYIVAGVTTSNDGDVSGNHGGADCWVVKLTNSQLLIENTEQDLFSVFPNPAKNTINIKADNKLIGKPYSIYDYSGKVVLIGKINSENTVIEISNLSGGIYLFSVGEDLQQTFKIIKE